MNDRDDLDALVNGLHAGSPLAASSDQQASRLRPWLEQVVARSASDLLIVAGAPPSLRVEGRVVPLNDGPLDGEEIAEAVAEDRGRFGASCGVAHGWLRRAAARAQERAAPLASGNHDYQKARLVTLEESLADLVKQGVIDRKDALTRAMHPEELERLLA
jgi:Tfp pilus assembly pilus retraction ATPase PilT